MLLPGKNGREACFLASDGADLDVGARALGEGVGEQREEGVDYGTAQGGWVGAEERGGECGLCYDQLRSRHGGICRGSSREKIFRKKSLYEQEQGRGVAEALVELKLEPLT